MKILELKVEGFRSLKSVTWKPDDLNVVIGPNAGGKSNLLQLLEMIAASAKGKLSKFVKEQGGMQPLVWDGQAEKIEINITTSNFMIEENDNTYSSYVKDIVKKTNNMQYSLELSRIGSSSSFRINKEFLKSLDKNLDNIIERTSLSAHVMDEEGQSQDLDFKKHDISESISLLFIAGRPLKASKPISSYQKELSSWCIYSEFNTCRDAPARQPFVTSYEEQVEADGQNYPAVLHTFYEKDRDFKKEINLAMGAAFGEDFEELSFPPAADGRTQLRIRWKSLKTAQSAANLSDGTLRFLYLLTILAHPEPPALIAIDEPETGLHPSMMSIIAEYAIEAARKTQVIITTHSPEFLGAFRDTRPTTTICEWHDGQTQLRVLSGDKLDYWLEEYTLGDLFRSGELEGMDK